MRRSSPWTIGALTLALACAPGEDAGTVDTATVRMGADSASARTVQLTAQGESGVMGNVTVRQEAGGAGVAIHMMGAAGTYTGHVHRGSCGSGASAEAARVAELGSITVPAGGMVDHGTTVSVPADSLLNGQHSVDFHRDGSGGPLVACADLR